MFTELGITDFDKMKLVTKIFGFEFEENNQEKINESRKMINTKVGTKKQLQTLRFKLLGRYFLVNLMWLSHRLHLHGLN